MDRSSFNVCPQRFRYENFLYTFPSRLQIGTVRNIKNFNSHFVATSSSNGRRMLRVAADASVLCCTSLNRLPARFRAAAVRAASRERPTPHASVASSLTRRHLPSSCGDRSTLRFLAGRNQACASAEWSEVVQYHPSYSSPIWIGRYLHGHQHTHNQSREGKNQRLDIDTIVLQLSKHVSDSIEEIYRKGGQIRRYVFSDRH